MKGLKELQNVLSKGKQEINTVRTLYLVMDKVGGYDVLCGSEEEIEYKFWKFKWRKKIMKKGIPISALQEIIKCMEHFDREESKAIKRK